MADQDRIGDDTFDQLDEAAAPAAEQDIATEKTATGGVKRILSLIVPAAIAGFAIAFIISNFTEDEDKKRQMEFMKMQRSFE